MIPDDILDTNGRSLDDLTKERAILERILEEGDMEETFININIRLKVLMDAIRKIRKDNKNANPPSK